MTGPRLNRITPALPADAMTTYRIARPKGTHWRPARCAEVDCAPYLHGWRTVIDESTEQGQAQAHYIRNVAGRGFTEARDEAGLTVFTFAAGQACFAAHQHRAPLDREPLYVVRGGDWRGNPRGTQPRVHTRPEDWVDDFATHQITLADRLAQG